ncbi:MAG TPA: hypothetical protein VIJ20_02650, partial [Solirubrobacteraceae bacterium]
MSCVRFLTRLVAVLAASLLVPVQAGAQSSSSTLIFLASGNGVPVSQRTIPVRFAGQLTVDFHGDAATGCASRGLCGYAGTVSWQPPRTGILEILALRAHGRLETVLELVPGSLGSPETPFGGVTTAHVQLSSTPLGAPPAVGSSCLDAAGSGSSFGLPLAHGRVTFALGDAQPSLLGTRCAGPLDGDVMPEIPAPTLPVGAILPGRTAVNLTGSHSFASHGFAGTVESSLTIALGRPGRPMRTQSGEHGHTALREVEVMYRAKLSGSVVEEVRGDSDLESCTPLGSCGLAGTLTLEPRALNAAASIAVVAPPRTPYRSLLAAVGLGRGRRPSDVAASGGVYWEGGSVLADLDQGSTSCRDSAPLGAGTLLLGLAKGRLRAVYQPGTGALSARTRCPGPADTAAPYLATGAVPASHLTRRT